MVHARSAVTTGSCGLLVFADREFRIRVSEEVLASIMSEHENRFVAEDVEVIF